MERVVSAIDKVPPQNLEAEQSVLGSMMLEPTALAKGLEVLRAEDFYRPAHQEIFNALAALSAAMEPADLITLQEELRKRKKLDDCGGTEYLMTLSMTVPTAANIEHYARIVEQKALLRRLMAAGSEIIGVARNEDEDAEVIHTKATQLVMEAKRDLGTGWVTADRAAAQVLDRIDRYTHDEYEPRFLWGLQSLNRATRGINVNGLYLIGGRPSNGKTCIANDVAMFNALAGKHIGYWTLETEPDDITERMAYRLSRVDSEKFKTKGWSSPAERDDWVERMTDATNQIGALADRIHFKSDTDMHKLCAEATSLKAQGKLDLMVIDYLQLIDVPLHKSDNRDTALSRLTRTLQKLAGQLKVPIVATSQLSRYYGKPTQKEDPKTIRGVPPPNLTSLREGGNQEAAAYVVILLHNPQTDDDYQSEESIRNCLAIVAKYKDGRTGSIPMWFEGGCYRFADMGH